MFNDCVLPLWVMDFSLMVDYFLSTTLHIVLVPFALVIHDPCIRTCVLMHSCTHVHIYVYWCLRIYTFLFTVSLNGGLIHKSRMNTNGTFSIGKTWDLKELTGLEVSGVCIIFLSLFYDAVGHRCRLVALPPRRLGVPFYSLHILNIINPQS